VNDEVILTQIKGQGHWERKCKKNRFWRIFLWKVDRLTSNKHQIDLRPFYSYRQYISPAETHHFAIFCFL